MLKKKLVPMLTSQFKHLSNKIITVKKKKKKKTEWGQQAMRLLCKRNRECSSAPELVRGLGAEGGPGARSGGRMMTKKI